MKQKVFILAILIIGGLSLLSCNQQGKSQQAEEETVNEEAAVEEKWDSIICRYKFGNNASDTGVIVLYQDGTAGKGSEKELASGKLDPGFWQFSSFTRGENEYTYIKITIHTFDLYYGEFVDVNYCITEERDMVYKDNDFMNLTAYKAMMTKSNGFEIVSWDVM